MDWDTLWLNCQAATMVPGSPYGAIRDAAIAARNGRIAWVGRRHDLPERRAAEIVDLAGCWVTPGLIDCHTHLIFAGHRAREFTLRLEGARYETIARAGGGILSTVEATRTASAAVLLRTAEARARERLAEGVTVLEIKSGYGLDVETELRMLRLARDLGERLPMTVRTTCLAAHALPLEYSRAADDYIDLILDTILPRAIDSDLVDAVDVFCEGIAFTLVQTERILRAARAYGLAVKLHAGQLSDLGGAGLAARYGALSVDHLEHVSEADVRAMAGAGCVAVLLPGAFYSLRESQPPPVALFRKYRVPMAIASDLNPGTSPVRSLRLTLNMACALFRLTPEEALAGVTRAAAQALGLQQDYGTLECGKFADLVSWDIDDPAELAYWIGGAAVMGRVRHGKLLGDPRSAASGEAPH
ncbi:MAG: imidazolonepropionase [Nitrococcus mobilis]|nr:imidazolonepropionase [Nitrococcus mobilis]